jgi:hypothetical protein
MRRGAIAGRCMSSLLRRWQSGVMRCNERCERVAGLDLESSDSTISMDSLVADLLRGQCYRASPRTLNMRDCGEDQYIE